ncbi:hypothetical protein D3C80_1664220 [compost metagenome]
MPFSVGCVSLVGVPPAIVPRFGPTSSTIVVMIGAFGGVASRFSTNGVVATLVLPDGSVAVIVSGCWPSANAGVGVKLQVPSAAVTLPICTPLS